MIKYLLIQIVVSAQSSPQPADCSSTLKLSANPLPDHMMNINYGRFSKVLGTFDQIFQNSDSKNCPITKCALKQKGCKSDYIGKNLKIKGKEIEAINFMSNWAEDVCVECTNGKQTIKYDNWKVS